MPKTPPAQDFLRRERGWSDRQLPDGTVIWSTPRGHEYVTKPGGILYFTALAQPTGDLDVGAEMAVPHPKRGVMMPKRRRPRFEDACRRLAEERRRNRERLVREQRQLADSLARDDEPPPF